MCVPLVLTVTTSEQAAREMISAEQCRAKAAKCERLGKAPDISVQRSTVLLSMAQSWETLAVDIERYEAVVRAESDTQPAG
jgi:hypothetical protein